MQSEQAQMPCGWLWRRRSSWHACSCLLCSMLLRRSASLMSTRLLVSRALWALVPPRRSERICAADDEAAAAAALTVLTAPHDPDPGPNPGLRRASGSEACVSKSSPFKVSPPLNPKGSRPWHLRRDSHAIASDGGALEAMIDQGGS
jgi:hypothetical protein